MTQNQPRVVTYARLSYDAGQADVTIARQQSGIREMLAAKGLPEPTLDLADPGRSAYSDRAKRPQYDRLKEMLARSEVDVVAVWGMDRLSRRVAGLVELAALLKGANAVVHSVTAGPIDLSTPGGVFSAQMLAAVAEYESSLRAARVKARIEQRVREEGRMSAGSRPFGWQYREDGKRGLEPHPTEAPIVVDLYERFLLGESLRGLAAHLTARGVPSVEGGRWERASVTSILKQPRNAGLVALRGEVTGPNAEGSLVSQDVWLAAQDKFKERKGTKRGGPTPTHLLTGFGRCPRCNERMNAGDKRATKAPDAPWVGVYRCRKCYKSVRRHLVEPVVMGEVASVLEAHGAQIREAQEATAPPRPSVIEAADLRRRLERLTRLWVAGGIDDTAFAMASREAQARIAELETSDEATPQMPDLGDDPATQFLAADRGTQRAVLRVLIKSIRLSVPPEIEWA